MLLALVLIAGVVTNPITATASDTSTRWDSFSESSGCGDPYTRTPFVSKQGSLADSEPILGPFGTYFGRSIAEVRSRLVNWSVPGSGGRTVKVHQAMLPALEQVAASLAVEATNGEGLPDHFRWRVHAEDHRRLTSTVSTWVGFGHRYQSGTELVPSGQPAYHRHARMVCRCMAVRWLLLGRRLEAHQRPHAFQLGRARCRRLARTCAQPTSTENQHCSVRTGRRQTMPLRSAR